VVDAVHLPHTFTAKVACSAECISALQARAVLLSSVGFGFEKNSEGPSGVLRGCIGYMQLTFEKGGGPF
jgi:hypothetical protein